MSKGFTVAIIGNPNSGKTTAFNGLTAGRQRVGNWPGVTVDRKSGTYRDEDRTVEVIDLPGIYSLAVAPGMDSVDERIAQQFLIEEDVDVILNVVDAANLERNLYLTAQLTELGLPMVVALNMVDVAERRNLAINAEQLADQLGCSVVISVANKGLGTNDLKAALASCVHQKAQPSKTVGYSDSVEAAIEALGWCSKEEAANAGVTSRWLAVRLLENDFFAATLASDALKAEVQTVVRALEAEEREDADILIADGRYGFANNLARHVVEETGVVGRHLSDTVDQLVLNRWLGLPIFFGLMYLMFTFTVNVGGAFIDFFDIAVGTVLVDGLQALLSAIAAPDWLKVFLAHGVGGGVQVVATFIPIIGALYLFLSVLESTGYMARAAYLMEGYMRIVGLPGKAFVPLIVGFGCNVPAIMASRTLDEQQDRILTVMMTPFMSCGARLAVYALFAAAFFPVGGQNIIFALYLIGIAVAIGTGFLLKHTLLKGDSSPLVMELPPYHVPQVRGVLTHTWSRLKSFVFGAGKIIIIVVVCLNVLNSIGTDGSFGNENSDRSVLSTVGRAIVPVFKPMGIQEDNWPATVGIFTGIFAKEAIVGTLDSLYSRLATTDAARAETVFEPVPQFSLVGGLTDALATIPKNLSGLGKYLTDPLGIGASGATSKEAAGEAMDVSAATFVAMVSRFDGTAGAFSYLLFILLYAPCVAALGAINREVGARWTWFSILWTTGTAYVVSVTTYQAATLMDHPVTSMAWLAGLGALAVAVVVALKIASGWSPLRTAEAMGEP